MEDNLGIRIYLPGDTRLPTPVLLPCGEGTRRPTTQVDLPPQSVSTVLLTEHLMSTMQGVGMTTGTGSP